MLASCSAASGGLPFKVGTSYIYLSVCRYRKDGDRQRRSMDAPTLLRVWHVLPSVTPCFPGEGCLRAGAGHLKDRDPRPLLDEGGAKDPSARSGARRCAPAGAPGSWRRRRPRRPSLLPGCCPSSSSGFSHVDGKDYTGDPLYAESLQGGHRGTLRTVMAARPSLPYGTSSIRRLPREWEVTWK